MIYFVTTGRADEVHVIQKLQPTHLLVSYFHTKNKPIKLLIDSLGYTPKLLLDSGAWSAYNTGKNISLIDYMNYIEENIQYIEHYVALDVIDPNLGDEFSKRYYEMMLLRNLDPIPVFHYGEDLSYLQYYVDQEPPFIALGGTAMNRSKTEVREWVSSLNQLYPDQPFHLLGSSSKQITEYTDLRSYDSSTWIMMASNGFPAHIPGKSIESKRERMKYHMSQLMKESTTNENRFNQLYETKGI